MKKNLLLAALLVPLTGCLSTAKLAKELRQDRATVEIHTPFGTFKRSMPDGITGSGATVIKTNITVPLSVPVVLQINQ